MKPDYRALERKLARGWPLADAAEAAGMPEEVALEYLTKRKQDEVTSGDERLLLFSNEALRVGMDALKAAVREKSRKVSESEHQGGSYKEEVIDVKAAQVLIKAALDARKMLDKRREVSKTTQVAGNLHVDLFDIGPWEFKKRD